MDIAKMKLAKDSEVTKLENENDKVEGKLISCEPSSLYPDSWALKLDTDKGLVTTFVNVIVKQRIDENSIRHGDNIVVVYKGLKKSERTGREYKSYDVYFE